MQSAYDGVAEQAGLLAKIIIPSAFPRMISQWQIENTPYYSGGTAPVSHWISLLSKNTPVPNYIILSFI
jgi:hypothetical protein